MRHTFLRVGLDLHAKKPLDSFIQVEETEWKAFLEELSHFEKKYRLLLNILDMDESRLQALATSEKKAVQSEKASRQLSMKIPEVRPVGEVKGGFLNRLKSKLELASSSSTGMRPGILSKQQPVAACSRCGSQIVRSTRYCQGCGADFGGLVCVCGRPLTAADRFCDRCGRGV